MPLPYLKYCPHCGNEDVLMRNNSELWQGETLYKTIVFCNQCGAQVEHLSFPRDGESPEAAEMESVRVWNQRRTPEGFAQALQRKRVAKELGNKEREAAGRVRTRRAEAERKRGELWAANVSESGYK